MSLADDIRIMLAATPDPPRPLKVVVSRRVYDAMHPGLQRVCTPAVPIPIDTATKPADNIVRDRDGKPIPAEVFFDGVARLARRR